MIAIKYLGVVSIILTVLSLSKIKVFSFLKAIEICLIFVIPVVYKLKNANEMNTEVISQLIYNIALMTVFLMNESCCCCN